MTKNDVIRLAREAGMFTHKEVQPELERFAALVAAAEREACAKVCDELADINRRASTDSMWQQGECAAAIRARGKA